jgi:hypothetical protein
MKLIMEHMEPRAAEHENPVAQPEQPATEAKHTQETKEYALNPHIRALMAERDEAERHLQEAILDLETREESPAFQKAKELYDAGVRVQFTDDYSDSDYGVIEYTLPGTGIQKQCTVFGLAELGNSVDFSNAHVHRETIERDAGSREIQVGDILDDLQISDRTDEWNVVRYLFDLVDEN